VSGRAKARREAKAADRIARRNQRAQADLQRRWHLTLAQKREIESAYAQAAAGLVRAAKAEDARVAKLMQATAAVLNAQDAVYEPHCVMTWAEQVAGMDDMGGLSEDDAP
jgi:hypothetical protein